jgi:hypothetical protein
MMLKIVLVTWNCEITTSKPQAYNMLVHTRMELYDTSIHKLQFNCYGNHFL